MGNFLAAAAVHCLYLHFFSPDESFKQPQLQMKLCVCAPRALFANETLNIQVEEVLADKTCKNYTKHVQRGKRERGTYGKTIAKHGNFCKIYM